MKRYPYEGKCYVFTNIRTNEVRAFWHTPKQRCLKRLKWLGYKPTDWRQMSPDEANAFAQKVSALYKERKNGGK